MFPKGKNHAAFLGLGKASSWSQAELTERPLEILTFFGLNFKVLP